MSDRIRAAMRSKYTSDGWALLFEVPNATGFSKSRSADAMAVSLWPSRGIDVYGFEFKASRSDWLRELKEPAKAEAFAVYCDYWTLCVTDKEVVKKSELPPKWGLQVLSGDSLKTVVQPDRLEAKEWPKTFLAAVLRAATQGPMKAAEAEIRNAEYKARAAAMEQARKDEERHHKHLQESLDEITKQVTEFERVTGVNVVGSGWRTQGMTELAKAVSLLNGATLEEARKWASNAARSMRDVAEAIEAAEKQLPSLAQLGGNSVQRMEAER